MVLLTQYSILLTLSSATYGIKKIKVSYCIKFGIKKIKKFHIKAETHVIQSYLHNLANSISAIPAGFISAC